MDESLYSVLLIVGLFMLGVVSPGPNFIVVVQKSLSSGRRAGIATGLGVATGDALYAAAGIFGLSALITQTGWLFYAIKIVGGLYIAWIGVQMMRRRESRIEIASAAEMSTRLSECFKMGLFTDLSNPKTIVFFASIFATVYQPHQSAWISFAMLFGIVVSSILWRIGLATVFSRDRVRRLYLQFRRGVERVFGGLLILLGIKLAISGSSQS